MSKRIICVIAAALIAGLCACPPVAAETEDKLYAPPLSFTSYTYNYWGDPVECPDPYTVTRIFTGTDMGTAEFSKPNDMAVDDEGMIYIAVSGANKQDNRIVKLDPNLKLLEQWYGYKNEDGKTVPFSDPLGLFVNGDGDIYLADGSSKNIYHMDKNCVIKRVIGAPNSSDSTFIDKEFIERYRPSKLVVDASGRIHVVAININEGIIEFDPEGRFEGFLAAGKVNASALELFWRKISTKEQDERMSDFVPIEYNNIALDKENFIFTSVSAIDQQIVIGEIGSKNGTEQGATVRRLNTLGGDILRRNGFGPPVGDYPVSETVDNIDAAYQGISQVIDVACAENGSYSILDNNRNRIFTYNSDGYLLYAFSGPDETVGGFRTPCSIVQYGEYIYVLDSYTSAVTQFTRTGFGRAIAEAIELQNAGEYDAAKEKWEAVLAMDANYDLAYSGVGKIMYQYGEYEEAMRLFKLGNDRTWYSRALKEHSKKVVSKAFAPAAVSLVVLLVVLRVVMFVRKRRKTSAGMEGN